MAERPSTGTGKLAGGSAKTNCKATNGCLIDEPTTSKTANAKNAIMLPTVFVTAF